MKSIIDSSVAFKWFVREHDTDKALQIRDDYARRIWAFGPNIIGATNSALVSAAIALWMTRR